MFVSVYVIKLLHLVHFYRQQSAIKNHFSESSVLTQHKGNLFIRDSLLYRDIMKYNENICESQAL